MKTRFMSTATLILLSILLLPAIMHARQLAGLMRATFPSKAPKQIQTLQKTEATDEVKLINSFDIDEFVKTLNKNGQLGYRLEKSVNYGGEGPTQSYAAVLRLDAGKQFEYDWLSSPDRKLLEGRLNELAKRGFNFVDSYPLTVCGPRPPKEYQNPIDILLYRLRKGDAFLLERINGRKEQSREYKVYHAKVHLGDSAGKTLQAAIDSDGILGFHPVKILFSKQSSTDLTLELLVEKNLTGENNQKLDYRFLKKATGLPNDVNGLAAQGFRFVAGRRIGLFGMVLMDKEANDAAVYTFIDERKYAKEFDTTVALGKRYSGIMTGDLVCGSTERGNERLVFVQNAANDKREYKILNVSFEKNGDLNSGSQDEFKRMLSENYRVKDLFYLGGLSVILEK